MSIHLSSLKQAIILLLLSTAVFISFKASPSDAIHISKSQTLPPNFKFYCVPTLGNIIPSHCSPLAYKNLTLTHLKPQYTPLLPILTINSITHPLSNNLSNISKYNLIASHSGSTLPSHSGAQHNFSVPLLSWQPDRNNLTCFVDLLNHSFPVGYPQIKPVNYLTIPNSLALLPHLLYMPILPFEFIFSHLIFHTYLVLNSLNIWQKDSTLSRCPINFISIYNLERKNPYMNVLEWHGTSISKYLFHYYEKRNPKILLYFHNSQGPPIQKHHETINKEFMLENKFEVNHEIKFAKNYTKNKLDDLDIRNFNWITKQLIDLLKRLYNLSKSLKNQDNFTFPTEHQTSVASNLTPLDGPYVSYKNWEFSISTKENRKKCLIYGEGELGSLMISPRGARQWVSFIALNELYRLNKHNVSTLWFDTYNTSFTTIYQLATTSTLGLCTLLDNSKVVITSAFLGGLLSTLYFNKEELLFIILRILSSPHFVSAHPFWAHLMYAPPPLKLLILRLIFSQSNISLISVHNKLKQQLIKLESHSLESDIKKKIFNTI